MPDSRSSPGRCARRARPRRARAHGVDVRARERPHRPAREPRRGRAVRRARHVPELVLRAAAVAVRGGRLRLPGVRPDARQRDERQDHPPARRRRAVRHPLRRAPLARARARPARPASCAAPPSGCRPPGAACPRPVDATRLVRRSARPRRSSTRSSRSTGRFASSSSRSSSRTSPRRRPRPIRAPPPCSSRRWPPRSTPTTTLRVVLVHSTRRSKLGLAAAWTTSSNGPDGTEPSAESSAGRRDASRSRPTSRVGERLRVVKFLAYAWSSQRSLPASATRSSRALAEARHTGWEGLLEGQRAYLEDFWDRADVELDGDTELQQAVRFALFHTLQAGARAERRAIAAKGPDRHRLRRPHVLGHRAVRPAGAHVHRSARRRRRTPLAPLDARPRARAGRTARPRTARRFPWRTIRGHECSGYWPAGTAAFHIGADIADAVIRYQAATGDEAFEQRRRRSSCWSRRRVSGARSATTTRRALPHRRCHRPRRVQRGRRQQRLHEPAVAQRNLLAAADAVARHPRHAAAFGADFEEAATWRDAARDMVVPWDDDLGVHPQSEGFTQPPGLGLRAHRARPVSAPPALPLLRSLSEAGREAGRPRPRAACPRRRVHRRGEGARLRLLRGADGRDSSLSACTQAVIAAEVGHLELAYDYFGEAALHRPARPRTGTRETASTSPPWPAPGSPRSPGSAACATTTAGSRSRRVCRQGCSG